MWDRNKSMFRPGAGNRPGLFTTALATYAYNQSYAQPGIGDWMSVASPSAIFPYPPDTQDGVSGYLNSTPLTEYEGRELDSIEIGFCKSTASSLSGHQQRLGVLVGTSFHQNWYGVRSDGVKHQTVIHPFEVCIIQCWGVCPNARIVNTATLTAGDRMTLYGGIGDATYGDQDVNNTPDIELGTAMSVTPNYTALQSLTYLANGQYRDYVVAEVQEALFTETEYPFIPAFVRCIS